MISTVSAGLRSEFSDHYICETLDCPITICLDAQVAERIQIATLTAEFSNRTSHEIGGVLYGVTRPDGDRRITFINDFRLVGAEDSPHSVYSVSDETLADFEAALAPSGSPNSDFSPVGFFRSHNRDGLFLSNEDLRIVSAYFRQPETVVMLIKTTRSTACTAGFFVRDGKRIESEFPCIEVPLCPLESVTVSPVVVAASTVPPDPLPADDSPVVDNVPPDPGISAEVVETELESPGVKSSGSTRLGHKLLIATPALLLGCTIMAFTGYLRHDPTSKAQRASHTSQAAIDLSVVETPEHLVLKWNSAAPEVLSAERAVLSIRDGSKQSRVVLDAPQLRQGETTYAASEDIVGLGIELYRSGKPVSAGWIKIVRKRPPHPGLSTSSRAGGGLK